jgi:hypothetical protein
VPATQVFVILFGVGMETEGIYSLRAISREDNLPQDTIIAFVDSVDAERYVPCPHAVPSGVKQEPYMPAHCAS